MAITDWPASERPREKLIEMGADALSDAELLAIFLRVGVVGKSAVDLARDLLSQFGSLNGIFAATERELSQVHGIGTSKYVQLQAIFEMSRRALNEQLQARDVFQSPQQVRNYLVLKLGALTREVFMVLFLDAQNRLHAAEELFNGTLTQTSVYPREVVKRAIHHNAASVIFAHNHPSGVAQQSAADELITQQLKQALALIDVRVLDHFIVAGNQTLSFAERGLL
ncbi:MAG: JAB domain-containing protein [Methylotenera sp.]|uniref:JAB domain-containing protein n=1 Tax=Methylotenera mobilis TaxID=359408 RepID=A0A351R8B6_9PROT|nr:MULTISPECIES: DNA repair protein RadC [Methylotenera]MDP3210811.1 DNA repair protein RadC [Methylotenera sp.]PPC95815.1 MAG: JAB domain-containing protein [Methylotenera sp.]PPC98889.1 MAG: JAB domain-containing protein [Methylotenera sp.]HBA08287.1 JAB domain-containing protein [Methylotenera mobilis]